MFWEGDDLLGGGFDGGGIFVEIDLGLGRGTACGGRLYEVMLLYD